MKVQIQQIAADSKDVSLNGHLTAMNHEDFRKLINDIKEDSACKYCTIGMEELDFIDSGGLGMLLLLREVCMKTNISLTIRNPKGNVRRILDVAKFNKLFAIHDTQ